MQKNVPQKDLQEDFQNDSEFRKMIREKLKEDPTTLAFILEELSKYGVDVDKESARDFVSFNLKTKLIKEVVEGYLGSIIAISFGIFTLTFSTILTMQAVAQDPNFLKNLFIDAFVKSSLIVKVFFFATSIILLIAYGMFTIGFIVIGIAGFINARKLHKALKASKKT